LRKLIKKILLEGRVEDMKKRYPEHEETVDFFVSNDPSNNNKYLQWMMKQVVKNGEERGFVLSLTKHFHRNVQRLQKKDINQYKKLEELQAALKEIGKSKGEQEREIKREGAHVVFENENVIALRPLNHKASCKYGAGTKWCVTMKDTDKYWDNYTKKTSSFAGTNWYESEWVEEEIEPTFIQKLLGKKPKTVKKEIKKFAEHFPVGILYFVIFKRRIKEYEWDDELQARIPVYVPANPKYKNNKLALLYKPGRADFGDMSWSEHFRGEDFMGMIGDRLDASHNNLSIFNALDHKVTLRELGKEFDEEFSVPFRFIEHDFQQEREKILYHVRNVLHKVFPLLGDKGSDRPTAWYTGSDGNLYHAPADQAILGKNKKGNTSAKFPGAKRYKNSHW